MCTKKYIFQGETLGGRVGFSTMLNRSKKVLEKVMVGKWPNDKIGGGAGGGTPLPQGNRLDLENTNFGYIKCAHVTRENDIIDLRTYFFELLFAF